MRLVVMGMVLIAAAALVAGYFGYAGVIAQGFMVVALLSIGGIVIGALSGGVRVSDARPDRRRLPSRIRAVI